MAYRILSLDGGGVWGLVEVKALIALNNNNPDIPGHDVLKQFDLVAGTSAGAIVLGAMLANKSLGDTLALFEDERTRKEIFWSTVGGSLFDGLAHAVAAFVPADSDLNLTGIAPQYSTQRKFAALRRILNEPDGWGDIPLSEAADPRRLHVLITAFDYDANRAVFFRSSRIQAPHWGEGDASRATLAEAIHASSTAPVSYFDNPACFAGGPRRYWDGAIAGCNNPVLAAVAEAIGKGHDPNDLAVLAIGTGSLALPIQQPERPPSAFFQPAFRSTVVSDLRKVATSILDDPPDVSSFLAHLMTGEGRGLRGPVQSRVVRLNPLISPVRKNGQWAGPGGLSEKEFGFLKDLALDAIEPRQVRAIGRYAELWLKDIAPNQPIRMDREFEAEIGTRKFSEGAAAWKALAHVRKPSARSAAAAGGTARRAAV